MKKKLLFIWLIVFALSFLLWPSFKPREIKPEELKPGEISPALCVGVEGEISSSTFCRVPPGAADILDKPAGGLITLIKVATNQSGYGDDIYLYWVSNEGYFYPLQALIYSAIIGLIASGGYWLVLRIKHKTVIRKPVIK